MVSSLPLIGRKLENIHYPLRIKLTGQQFVQIFVNGLYIGRYWGNFGPQHNFYIMDEILNNGENPLVLATYSIHADDFKVEILPYYIEEGSGNIKEDGVVFATQKFEVDM